VFVVDVTSTVLICICVSTIMTGLMGYGYQVMGLELTSSLVNSLIMCIGFSVDYCAHVVVAYLSVGKEGHGHGHSSRSEPGIASTTSPKTPSSKEKLAYTLQVIIP
jgi:predicted RND superfamily exporter protein